jgi:hypothetical protein
MISERGPMSITTMKPATALLLASLLLPPLRAAEPSGAPGDAVVTNGTDWVDAAGRPIMAHEGDLARFDGVFFKHKGKYIAVPPGRTAGPDPRPFARPPKLRWGHGKGRKTSANGKPETRRSPT